MAFREECRKEKRTETPSKHVQPTRRDQAPCGFRPSAHQPRLALTTHATACPRADNMALYSLFKVTVLCALFHEAAAVIRRQPPLTSIALRPCTWPPSPIGYHCDACAAAMTDQHPRSLLAHRTPAPGAARATTSPPLPTRAEALRSACTLRPTALTFSSGRLRAST